MGMNAIGLNIFGGGFTLGMRESGLNILGQFEECDAGKRTWALNYDELEMERPMRHSQWPIARYRRKAQVVYANPPCAPWSSVNTRHSGQARFSDPRLVLSAHSMEAGLQLEPEVFIMESVPNAYTIGIEYYHRWAREWLARGYMVTYFLTDALLHGVPSTRQRFHFIAHRHELPLEPPDMRQFMPNTLRQAIGELEDKPSGYLPQHTLVPVADDLRACMEATGEGDCVAPVVRDRKARGLYDGTLFSFLIRRQMWDAPAFTVLYMEAMVHPNGKRWLTLREGLRLCGYPDSFRIHSPKEATQAVLPPVGRYLGHLAQVSVRDGLSGQRRGHRGVRVVDWRALAKPYRPGAVREALLSQQGL